MAEPDLDAAVVYYGRLVTDTDQLARIEAPILGVFGNAPAPRSLPRGDALLRVYEALLARPRGEVASLVPGGVDMWGSSAPRGASLSS